MILSFLVIIQTAGFLEAFGGVSLILLTFQSENLLELWQEHFLISEIYYSKEWIIDKKIREELKNEK